MLGPFVDLCRFLPTLGGTTDWVYSSAVSGCQSPAAANVLAGRQYWVYAISNDFTQWEISTGVNSGVTTFPRTTVVSNSSGTGTAPGQTGAGTKINFSTVPQVAIVQPAEYMAVGESYALGASVAGSALTISLFTEDGINASPGQPLSWFFRSTTAATGSRSLLQLTGGKTLTISSGSTMGFADATAGRIWICLFNDAGTLRLGAINCRSATQIFNLNEDFLYSATAEGGAGAADSAGVVYGPTTFSGAAMRILGYMEWSSGLTTAGTWGIVPTKIQIYAPGVPRPTDIVQSSTILLNEGATISSVTHTNTTIDGIASTARLQKGMSVTGTNVAANTVITAINSGTSITVNNATTGSATNNLTYSWVTNNATTAFVDTALSITGFTLTSAANSVSYAYSATTISSAASVLASTAMRRGGVQVSPTFPGAFSSSGVGVCPAGGQGGDFPGSVGPFTYTVALKSSAATNVSANDSNGGGFASVAEVMC